MLSFRNATKEDAGNIAMLHTESWKNAYKGILSDEYLSGQVLEDRLETWKNRFVNPPANQFIILAEEKDFLVGFVCIYGNLDKEFGSLIDNLHVKPAFKGKGIGKNLLKIASDLIFEKFETRIMHLWVFEANTSAIAFYEICGGKKAEKCLKDNPDGTQSYCFRMVWGKIEIDYLQAK